MGQREIDAGTEVTNCCPDCGKRIDKKAKKCAACAKTGAMTSEQRSTHALCGAMTKRGVLCRAFAGQGTEHSGVGTCKFHGGSTIQHRRAGVALEAQARMVKLGLPVDGAQPHQVLLGLLRASAGHVGWLHQEIGALDDLDSREGEVMVRLYGEERDRAARIAKACSEAGVEEAEVRFAQANAEQLTQLVRRAASDAGLSDKHVRALGAALRKQTAQAQVEQGEDAHEAAAKAEEQLDRLREELRADEDRRITRLARDRRAMDSEWAIDAD